MEVSGQLHDPAALPPGKHPRYPLDRRLGGSQWRPWRDSEGKKAFTIPAGIRTPVVQPAA
jgi:hypothetical protein